MDLPARYAYTDQVQASWVPPLASSTSTSSPLTPPTLPGTSPTLLLALHTCTRHSKPSQLSSSLSPGPC